MITPGCNEIEALAKGYSGHYSVIPVCREIYADVITPITLLRKLSRISKNYFLLESIEGGEKWGRYSFLGFDPVVHVTCKNRKVTIENGRRQEISTDQPFEVLRRLLKEYNAPRLEGVPPFTGGLVGYFSYEMIGYAEPVLKLPENEFQDFDLMLFDKVIAYDHLKQKISIVVNIKIDRVTEKYKKAVEEIEALTRFINGPTAFPKSAIVSKSAAVPEPAMLPEAAAYEKSILVSESGVYPGKQSTENPCFTCNVTKEEFCDMVRKTKEHIIDGDIFQAVISRRFETEYQGDLLNAYRVLRTLNPSPYMVFLKSGEVQLICSSPETMVRLKDGTLSTFPIAGSRPRGKDKEEDDALAKELLEDEKELSEHNMLVDLARNDIGRISEYGGVRVSDYMRVQRYSRIMHITSEVEGRLRGDRDALDAIGALLPAGTLSGAPKIRACEIIRDLENDSRGIYGGAIGYIDFTGNMDTCIAIRMAVKRNNKVTIQAGAGIVADSVPEKEYEEAGNKARALMEAILQAGEVE